MTSPLYAQVENRYLEDLHKCKDIVDRIGFENASTLADSLEYARTKHPSFANTITDVSLDLCRDGLELLRHDNDMGEKLGFSIATDILKEEILEALEQHLLGNRKECLEELSQAACVIIRMMDMERSMK